MEILDRRIPAILVALVATLSLFAVLATSASASTQILYDQTTGTPGGFVPSEFSAKSSGTYECNAPTYIWQGACYAADDFTVPPGPAWDVQSVHVDGQGGAGDAFVWTILPSEALPAALDTGAGNGSIGSGSARPGSPLSGVNNFDIPAYMGQPNIGFALLPGHYWLKVYASNPNAASWAWQTQSPQTGYEAAWQDHDCSGSSGGFNLFIWKHLSECGKTGPDLRFSLTGQLIDSAFSSFQLSKPRRLPSGGLAILAATPTGGTFTIRKLAGKGKIETHVSAFYPTSKDNSAYTVGLQIKPAGKTKAALKLGKKFKMRVAISYTRVASTNLVAPSNSISAPPNTKTLKVVLKKPRRATKH